MLRKGTRRLLMEGERSFIHPGESPITSTGGLPFYGNLYTGRVDSQNYLPPRQGGSGLLDNNSTLWDNPAIREKLQSCPYFALSDQVMYHNMDPVYLDPGLLSPEEHQLLLLFSRAYYEKWKEIHRRPPHPLPQLRINYGSTKLLDDILFMLDVQPAVGEILKKEYAVDDASLIGMNPNLWSSAYLDPANMDQLSGRVLEFAGVQEPTRRKFFLLLEQMRRIKVHRRDLPSGEEKVEIVPFHFGVTLFDLCKYLGLGPYNGQLKVYDMVDMAGTMRAETLKSEDVYFDFLIALFFRADIRNATLTDLADAQDNTCRYTVTVEPFTADDRRKGRWF
ncbi:hypothetical protein ABB37_03397 [Leptomonas pyrrhocoris]|uniref:Uncharacterized protein n=1 Tax=Leptomonas pyrrhocoris TaxID=157538 RepID=A0A0N0DWX7_LEPPY|nr:hypothetical protein ABB37_03397 [Leptomonas pyrrhocoris]KPA82292.1 hypothetical protein ABB37_03397 [Leptomonas pyrrhocoris]|eukprot:XP_015660731.1 hypothetical protein ABB37_03397 [Leptomonas pyrrhocoris]